MTVYVTKSNVNGGGYILGATRFVILSPKYILISEAEVRALAKERQKKDNHNLSKSEKKSGFVNVDYS